MTFIIEPMGAGDWEAVAAIYGKGIGTGDATFETTVPDWSHWNDNHLTVGRLVARKDSRVIGWAALSPVSDRLVYAGVAEVSVYVAAVARGQGVGKKLLQTLVTQSEQNGIWTLQAGIFPENEASVAIHQQCGFRIVGRREKLGQMGGHWRDVLLLERRSSVVRK
ncbi:MAG: N-acetyltransferase [Chloroflexi bacterium]|nr:N-acetyltransferase [Chloroflexota bacterium]